jgi:hypothetical protein
MKLSNRRFFSYVPYKNPISVLRRLIMLTQGLEAVVDKVP